MNPFVCNFIDDGFPISDKILTEKEPGELDLFEVKEDQALQMLPKVSFMIEFWKHVPESKYHKLKKKVLIVYIRFFVQIIVANVWMKFAKPKYLSLLTNQHLKEFLKTTLILRLIFKIWLNIVFRCDYTIY